VRRNGIKLRDARLRAFGAALAALVLLLQGLIPGAALAYDHPREIQLCTAHGVKLVRLDHGKGGHFGGLACEQCVMASLTAVAGEPPPEPPPTAFAYDAPPLPAPAAAPRQARAPPRPPSTAPPVLA
jgi:hypothetical protein